MYSIHVYSWFCSLNAFSPVRITKIWWSRLSCFGGEMALPLCWGKKKSPSQKSFIKDEAKHNSILWIVYLKFIPPFFKEYIPVFYFIFFSFNVRLFFFYGCGRCCHFSRSFLPELSLLLLDVCFEKKNRSVYLINKPATQFARQKRSIYGDSCSHCIRSVMG